MPSTAWKEVIAADEPQRFAGYAEMITALQKRRDKGPKLRGFHPKAILGARAQLSVNPDLPEHARQGLFAQPKTYDAWVRVSNGAVRPQSDRKGDVRGFVFKVLAVPGKKTIAALADETTQDFSLIHVPALPFRDSREFMWFAEANGKPLTLLPRMIGYFGLGRTLAIIGGLKKGLLKPIASIACEQFWSPMAIQFGPYAARYALKPVAPPPPPKLGSGPTYLGDDHAARLAVGPLAYDLLAYFFEDETTTPIENTSVEWKVAPVTIARLTLVKQDVHSAEGRALAEKIEAASFNPWHALVEHKPLGDMMRARDPAYLASTTERGAANEPR